MKHKWIPEWAMIAVTFIAFFSLDAIVAGYYGAAAPRRLQEAICDRLMSSFTYCETAPSRFYYNALMFISIFLGGAAFFCVSKWQAKSNPNLRKPD